MNEKKKIIKELEDKRLQATESKRDFNLASFGKGYYVGRETAYYDAITIIKKVMK